MGRPLPSGGLTQNMTAIAAARLWSPVGGAPWKGGGNPKGGGGRLPSDDGGSIGAVCVGGV